MLGHKRGNTPSSDMSTLDSRSPLLIPDLLCDILESFSPEIRPVERQTLVALARTCRALSGPCLDHLWRKLYSLKPLIRCYTSMNDADNPVPPTSSQVAVIDRYSYRIRELTISASDRPSLRFLQCMSMRPGVFLPNLTALHWGTRYHPTSYVPIIFIQHVLSPILVSLAATLAEIDGPILLSFLNNYPLLCRNLKTIEFHFVPRLHSEAIIQALSQAICSHDSLENLILDAPINAIAWRYLSTLQTLRELKVTIYERSKLDNDSFPPTEPIFCNADILEFVTWNLDLVTSLLRPRDQKFHSFRLCHRGRQTSEDIHAFLSVLASRPPAIPLRAIALTLGDYSHPITTDQMASEAMRYRLTYKTIQPLTILGSLRELMIQWSEQISLDDDDVVKLARSWPLLQVFNVYCGRGGYPPFQTKYATLRGLLSLVNTCPALHTVSLPLDARQVPEAKETEVCETNFTCLIVPESPIDDALSVATFLFTYLPRVTAVDARFLRPPGTDHSQIITYEKAWQQVELHLEELHFPLVDPIGLGSEDSDDSYDSDD